VRYGDSRGWCWRLARVVFGACLLYLLCMLHASVRCSSGPHFSSRYASSPRCPWLVIASTATHASCRCIGILSCTDMQRPNVVLVCACSMHHNVLTPAALPPVTVRRQGFYCHPRLIALYISLVTSAVGLIAGLAIHPRTRGEDWAGVRNTLYGATVRGLCCLFSPYTQVLFHKLHKSTGYP
jgi:hypothetical protein